MKITGVETKIYKWNLPQPITNGLHTYSTVTLNIIEIHTDQGITGIGLTGGVKDGEKIVKEIILNGFFTSAPFLRFYNY